MKICVFGGSTTWGQDDTTHGGWVTLLQLDLAKNNHYLYNLGISGDTTNEMVSRTTSEIKCRKPKLVIFSIGLNDSALIAPELKPRVSKIEFENNISLLLQKAQQLNTQIIFIGPTTVTESKTTPIPWDTTKHYTNSSAINFDRYLEVFCTNNNVDFISLISILKEADISNDGLHPNTSGHHKIYETVKPYIKKVISGLLQ